MAAQEGRLQVACQLFQTASLDMPHTVRVLCLFTGDAFPPCGGLSSSESQRQHHGHQEAWGKSLKPQGLVLRDGTGVPSAEFYWHQQWNWREANPVY